MFMLLHVYFGGSVEEGRWKYLKFKGGINKNCISSEGGPVKIFRVFSHIDPAPLLINNDRFPGRKGLLPSIMEGDDLKY